MNELQTCCGYVTRKDHLDACLIFVNAQHFFTLHLHTLVYIRKSNENIGNHRPDIRALIHLLSRKFH